MEDARAAFASIPPVTQTLLVAFLGLTLPALGGALDLRNFGFYLPDITKKYEVWRLLTSYLYAGKGINLLFDLFLFHRTSVALEVETHFLDTAEYAWSLAFLAVGIQGFNLYLKNWFLFRPLLIALVHLWARSNATTKVSLFGLISIPSTLYPPALLALDFIQGGPEMFYSGLSGLLVAHAYWFATEGLPEGKRVGVLRNPPRWWRNSFGAAPGGVRTSFGEVKRAGTTGGSGGGGVGREAAAARAAGGAGGGGGHQWGGQGNRLGNA